MTYCLLCFNVLFYNLFGFILSFSFQLRFNSANKNSFCVNCVCNEELSVNVTLFLLMSPVTLQESLFVLRRSNN